jgi:hypothetical protein
VERTFSGSKFQCIFIERNSGSIDATQYCFEPESSVLRYNRGWGWNQTVYNDIVLFQERNLARQVDVTDGGKRYLELRVEAIELIPNAIESDFVPPPDAVGIGDRVSDVPLNPISTGDFPKWPASLNGQHFTVTVKILIGKDGHVLSAQGISGPPEAYKGSEEAARKWVYPPFLVLGKPVEVEEKIQFSKF